MRRVVWLAVVLGLAACGAEDIGLGQPTLDAATGDDAGAFRGDSSASPCEEGTASCRPLGAACTAGGECCAAHCASGICAAPTSCAGAGVACTSRDQCCSGLCEPVAGSTALACLPEGEPDGKPCASAADCCSLACNGGTCGGRECLREGTDCVTDADCCSGECAGDAGSKCVLDPVATCRAAGDDCHSGGGAPCCGVCDDSSGRCDLGPGPLRPSGSVCTADADCARGSCAANAGGVMVCTSAPLEDGVSCLASFECASQACVGNPPVCGVPSPPCSALP